MPIDLTADTYLPEEAATLLKQRNLTPEQSAYLEAHTVPNPAAPETDSAAAAESTPAVESAPGEASTEKLVKGKTSFQEILDWGVSQEVIEKIIGGDMPSPLVKIKDHCAENGLDFETIKTALQAEVNAAQP